MQKMKTDGFIKYSLQIFKGKGDGYYTFVIQYYQ